MKIEDIHPITPIRRLKKKQDNEGAEEFSTEIHEGADAKAPEVSSISFTDFGLSEDISVESDHAVNVGNMMLDYLEDIRDSMLVNNLSKETIDALNVFVKFSSNIRTENHNLNNILNEIKIRSSVTLAIIRRNNDL